MRIGNPEDLAGLQDRLQGFLPQATLMVVVVTASTNTGRQLTPAEWTAVQQACDICFRLDTAKKEVGNVNSFTKYSIIQMRL